MPKRFRKPLSTLAVLLAFSALSSVSSSSFAQLDSYEEQKVEAFQVFDNLYYVGAKWVSAWVLETSQGLILFDALYGELTDIIIEGMDDLGLDPDDIRYVIGTHAHFDHIGGARRFQTEYGAIMGMTEQDWAMTLEPAIYQEYERPIKHLTFGDNTTLNLGDTRVSFYHTPGHTPGVLSASFDVRDGNFIHRAFMFGGVGLNFSGVERTQMYLDSVAKIKQLQGIAVNIPNHEGSGEVFERAELLKQREPGDPHPFVDAERFQVWLDELQVAAEAKMVEERAAEAAR